MNVQGVTLVSVIILSLALSACGGSSSDNSHFFSSSTSTTSSSTTLNTTAGGSNTTGTTGNTTSTNNSTAGSTLDNSSSAKADDCFNVNLYSASTKVEMTTKTVTAATSTTAAAELTSTSVNTVKANTIFNGQSVIEIASEVTATGSDPSKSTQSLYFTVDNANLIEYFYGSMINVIEPAVAAGKTTLTLTPALADPFALSANQAVTQTYKARTDGTVMGFPYSQITEQTHTKQFVGLETVTVPAGTFKACRFEETDTATISGNAGTSNSTHWVAVDSGIEVKALAGNKTTQLISASINGSALTGQ